jgi:hypothetical protein
MKPQQAPRPIATLPIPNGVSNLITLAHTIVTKMTGNPYFPSPSPSLATVQADITALQPAEVLAQTKAKGAAEARNAKERALRNRLHYLKVYVQEVADGDPANAEAIITSGSYSVRKVTARAKQELEAKMGRLLLAVEPRSEGVDRPARDDAGEHDGAREHGCRHPLLPLQDAHAQGWQERLEPGGQPDGHVS